MKLSIASIITALWLLQGLQASSNSINFDLQTSTGDTYAKFIEELRKEAEDKTLSYYNIPMMPPAPSPPAYQLVELKVSEDATVKVALNRSNLYVIGYCDNYEGKHRAHFFNDAPPNAVSDLFKEAKSPLRFTLSYSSRYGAIEKKAGVMDRRKVGLGIGKWKNVIDTVNNHQIDEKKEAIFLLLTIQTISEATRFKYIEQKIIQNLEGFTPDYKVRNLEEEWSKITKAITESKDGKFTSPLSLKDAADKPWKVTRVEEIAPDMGLLCFYLGKKSTTV